MPSYPPKMEETAEDQKRRVAAASEIDKQFMRCLDLHKEFEKTFSMAEFYIGRMPDIPFSGKMTFSIPYEYGMIIGLLRWKFLEAYGTSNEMPDKHMEERIKAYEDYFGWGNDYADDEFTERLSRVRTALERRMRPVLQHRGVHGKVQAYIDDRIMDAIARRRKKKSEAKRRLATAQSERSV